MGHTFLYDDYFQFLFKLFVVMDGISGDDLFQANASSKGYNGNKCAIDFFYNFD